MGQLRTNAAYIAAIDEALAVSDNPVEQLQALAVKLQKLPSQQEQLTEGDDNSWFDYQVEFINIYTGSCSSNILTRHLIETHQDRLMQFARKLAFMNIRRRFIVDVPSGEDTVTRKTFVLKPFLEYPFGQGKGHAQPGGITILRHIQPRILRPEEAEIHEETIETGEGSETEE